MRDEVAAFYDELADDYSALFRDWDASIARQAEILDSLIRARWRAATTPTRIYDGTCGVGTQAIGLALRGYEVFASDISTRAVDRARREAERLGAHLEIGVADVRALRVPISGPVDVAVSLDNALPHFLRREELEAAFRGLSRVVTPGGLVIVSVRDYDAILAVRPSGEPPRITAPAGQRRVTAQAWEWQPDEPVYRVHQFVLREGRSGRWSIRHAETRYRAYRREELAAAAVDAGLADVSILMPPETGFYQPILVARRP